MFETSVVTRRAAGPRRKAVLLTLSLAAHSLVAVAAVAMSIVSIEFPDRAPDEFGHAPVLVPLRMPPPLGSPAGDARPRSEPVAQSSASALRPADTAPSRVPETVTPSAGASDGVLSDGSAAGSDSGPLGVPWGIDGSIGDIDAPPSIDSVPEQRVYEAAEVNPPVLVHRVEPLYPPVLLKTRMAATVVVRCVIDRNGNVRDAQIVSPAMPPFNQSVLDAVAKWRFRPGSLGGHAVDTYLNLTVNFSVR